MKIFSLACLALFTSNVVWAGIGQTLTVNSTFDEPDLIIDGNCNSSTGPENRCTLRAAIEEANNLQGITFIHFNINDSGCVNDICTITVDRANLGSLPDIVGIVEIDGSTQPGNATVCSLPPEQRPDYKIVVQGDSIEFGLRLEAGSDSSIIRGLNVRNFTDSIAIVNSSDNRIECNLIGTDETGLLGTGLNTANGIIVGCESNNNILGGPNAANANVIADQDIDGIQYFAGFVCPTETSLPSNNAILGNYIGIAKDGITPLGNIFGGISFYGGPTFGHYIGTLQDGTTINGNVIGNSKSGIYISDGSNNINIKGNFIGTNRNGVVNFGNVFGGVDILSGSNNIIGGINPGEANTIAYKDRGVFVTGNDSLNNQIRGNHSINNIAAIIDITQNGSSEPDGLNPNDINDVDTGANNLMNHPDIISAAFVDNLGVISVDVELTVDTSPANAIYPLQIDVYFDGSEAVNQGSLYTDSGAYTLPQTITNFTFSLPDGVEGGHIRLTATDAAGNTSEMSPPFAVGFIDLIFKDGFD